MRGSVRCARVVPVLVVDGELAAASWNSENSRFDIAEVDRVDVAWLGTPNADMAFMTIHVVRRDHLPTFVDELAQWGDRWCEVVDRGGRQLHEKEQKRMRDLALQSKYRDKM